MLLGEKIFVGTIVAIEAALVIIAQIEARDYRAEVERNGVAHRNGDGCILNVADPEYDYISYTAK